MSTHTAKHTQVHSNTTEGLYPKMENWPEIIWWFGYLPHVSGVK